MAPIFMDPSGTGKLRPGPKQGASASASVAAIAVAGILAVRSLAMTPDNGTVANAASQGPFSAYVTLPAGITKPAAGTAWAMGLFFETSENAPINAATQVVATAGGNSGAGGSDFILSIGNTVAADGTVPLNLRARVSSSETFGGSGPQSISVPRRKRFFTLFGVGGSDGKTPFWSVYDTDGNQYGSSLTFPAGTDASGSLTNMVRYLGAAGGLGSVLSGYVGRLQNFGFFTNGAIPLTNGKPDAATVQAIAMGKGTLAAFAASLGMTSLCEAPLSASSNACTLNTQASTYAIGGGTVTPSVVPVDGEALVPCTWLTLSGLGDGYVWGVRPGQNTGTVYFSGSYATSNGIVPSLEARLVRVDTGQPVAGFDWQPLTATVAAGIYAGALPGVPAGVGFTRQIRFAGQPATLYAANERHGVGIAGIINAQSQAAHFFYPGIAGAGSGSGAVQPTDTVNSWGTYLGAPNAQGYVDNSPPNFPLTTPAGAFACVRRITSQSVAYFGDGMLMILKKLRDLTGWPVMLLNNADGGQYPLSFYGDRKTIQTVSQNLTGDNSTTTFAPTIPILNGTINTALTGQPLPFPDQSGTYPALPINNNVLNSAVILPGSLQMTVGGVLVTDTPNTGSRTNGTLSGNGITGTINYSSRAVSLTFATAPASGPIAYSSSFTFIADLANGQSSARATPTGFSNQGVQGQPASGQTANLYDRLGAGTLTFVASPWWTAWKGTAGYLGGGRSTGAGSVPANTNYVGTSGPRYNVAKEWDGLKQMHRSYTAGAYAMFFPGPASREGVAGVTGAGTEALSASANYGAHRVTTRDYAAARASDTRLLAEDYDATIPLNGASNSGAPHQTFSSYVQYCERLGISIANGLGLTTQTTEGPYVTAVAMSADKTTITLTYGFKDAGATSLKTRAGGGVGSTLKGFDVGTSGTSGVAAWSARVLDGDSTNGFTAKISSANTVTITKASGAWNTFTTLSYAAGNIWSGGDTSGSTTYAAADATTMGSLLTDDAGAKYAFPTGTPANTDMPLPAGNLARPVLDLLYNGSAWSDLQAA